MNRVKGLISAQYIYKVIATFSSKYFSSKVETIHNQVQRNDDMGIKEQNNIFSVFCSSARPFGKTKEHLLIQNEKDVVELYVFDNYDKISPFVEYLSLSFSKRLFNQFKYNIISLCSKSIFANNLKNN